MSPKPFAFVLMPFDEKFDDIYSFGIKAAAEDAGFIAERVDEQKFSETILDRIYRQIESADLIIADMSGRNPNVFYEVGYAHARGKRSILLTNNSSDIPFDLKHHRHLIYEGKLTELRKKLSSELAWQSAEIEKSKKSTFQIDVKTDDGMLSKTNYSAYAEIELEIDVRNNTNRRSPEIEALYLYTGNGWTYDLDGQPCANMKADFEDYALRHFVRSPMSRISPGAWVPIKLNGKKQVWSKFKGDELKDSYRLVGRAVLEIITSEGVIRETINLDVNVDEIPF